MNKKTTNAVNVLPLAYALNLLTQFVPIPTHVFKQDNHYLEKFDTGQADDWNVLKTDYPFRVEILEQIRKNGIAVINKDRPVIFGGVQCKDNLTLVIGPVVTSDPDPTFCKLYALKHNAVNVSLLKTDIKKFASFLLLIYSSVSEKYIFLSDFLDQNFISEDIVGNTQKNMARIFSKQSLENKPHNPGSFEASIRLAIRNGDIEGLKKALNSIYANMRGTIGKTPLRTAQNLAIVDITIAVREAIDAGLGVEEMYIMSDAFILEVEECKTTGDAAAIARRCALNCAMMVAKYKKKLASASISSHIVVKACNYLDRHAYEKFDVEKMCAKLKVSSGYLSKLFKQEKNMTLGQYMRLKKIEIAKMLLSGTDKSITDIALMLSFNSQSHFGRIFSAETGESPGKYRNRTSIRDSVF